MIPQEVFEIWKARKAQGDVGSEFTDQVMIAIWRRESARVIGPAVRLRAAPMGSALKIISRSHGWLSPLLLKRNLRADPKSPQKPPMAARPWAKAAALILGTLLGLARIIVTIHLILFA